MRKGQTITLVILTDKEWKVCQACPYWVELNGKHLCYKEDYKECRIKECKALEKKYEQMTPEEKEKFKNCLKSVFYRTNNN